MLFSPHCLREDIIIQSNFLFVANDMIVKFSFCIADPAFYCWRVERFNESGEKFIFFAIGCFPCHAIENQNQNRLLDKVQNLGNDRR